MKYLSVILFLTVFFKNHCYSQCTVSSPSEPTSVTCGCTGGFSITTNNASVTVNAGETYCVNSDQSVTGLSVTLNGGTLNICGTATISSLTISNSISSSTYAYIRVGSGASLTITPNITFQQYLGILNLGGTLTFNGAITQNNSHSFIINGNSTSKVYFNQGYIAGGSASDIFINRGTATFASGFNFTISSAASVCLEKSNTILNGNLVMQATNGLTFGGTVGAKNAIINYSSTASITYSNALTSSTDIKFCRGNSATDYSSCFGTNNGGSCNSPSANSCTSSGITCNWVGAGSASYSGSSCSSPVPVLFLSLKAEKQDNGILVT